MKTLIPWAILVLAGFVLSGCSLPIMNLTQTGETKFFADSLDQIIESGDLRSMKRLPELYPKGEWRARAEYIIALAETNTKMSESSADLLKLHKKLEAQLAQKDKDLAASQLETEHVRQDNEMLEATLVRLKELLIDMEQRSN